MTCEECDMPDRTNPLRHDPIPVLLAVGDAALSYFVRRDLLEDDSGPTSVLWELPGARRLLRKLGLRLVAGGAIAQPQDIYWLEAQEADALAAALEANEPLSCHAASVKARRTGWQRARQAEPPTVLPENHLLDAAFRHGFGRRHRYWRSAKSQLDRGARIRHPCGHGYRRGHPPHPQRADDRGRWGCRDRDAESVELMAAPFVPVPCRRLTQSI